MIELAVEFLLETGTLLLKAYGDSRDEKKATVRPEGAPKVDLSPLIDSIEHLQTSNEEIVDVLRHPSRAEATRRPRFAKDALGHRRFPRFMSAGARWNRSEVKGTPSARRRAARLPSYHRVNPRIP